MAEAFGTIPPSIPPVPSIPVPGGKEGASGGAPPRTVSATVVRVLATEGGAVVHEVRLSGGIALLESPTAIEVGTVLEVLARREAVGWRAFLPGAVPPPRSGVAPAPGGVASVPPNADAPPVGLIGGKVPPQQEPTSAADRVARQLLARGVEPTPPLVRGGVRVESAPSVAEPVGTTHALAATLSRLATPLARALPRGDVIHTELAALRTILAESALPPESLARIPEQVVRGLAEAIERIVANDPRIAALRQAISSLLSDRSPVDLPVSVRGLLSGVPVAGELPEGLTTEARARGLEALRAHEVRAITEHPVLSALRPLLGEVVEQAEALGYRLALELADPDREFREGTREWVWATEEKRARVRWHARARGTGEGSAAMRFRLSTTWPLLGAIEVTGTLEDPRAASIDLTFAAERALTRQALRTELPALVESLRGSGTAARAALRPWRPRGQQRAPEAPRALDRKA